VSAAAAPGAEVDVPSGRPASVPTPVPGDPRLARLSLNTATTKRWTLREAVDGCVRAGLPALGLWRDRVAEVGAEAAGRMVADAGLRVSSLCRGGFLTAPGDEAGAAALEDNRAAVREAAAVGARELVLVVGGLPAEGPARTDLVGARERLGDRLGELVPCAVEHGVRLALEPLHPLFASDRAVLSTLGQALELASAHPAGAVGVVVDAYHVWWDPDLRTSVLRAGAEGRISSYQVCDWVLPLAADPLLSRGMVGDGHVDFARLGGWVGEAGYTGDVEVEIFNEAVWSAPGDAVLATLARRYVEHVLPTL